MVTSRQQVLVALLQESHRWLLMWLKDPPYFSLFI